MESLKPIYLLATLFCLVQKDSAMPDNLSLEDVLDVCPARCECHYGKELRVLCDNLNLTSVPDFSGFEFETKPIDLYLNGNNISHILASGFSPFAEKLRTLDISNNKQPITIARTAFVPVSKSLEVLRLEPLIYDLNEEFRLLSPLISLKEVSLTSANQERAIHLTNTWFKENQRQLLIPNITLVGNNIHSISPGIFRNVKVMTLDLSHNLLSTIPNEITAMLRKTMTSLRLDHNVISTIASSDFPDGCSLVKLYLRANRIKCVSSHAFSKCSRLTFIDLSYNLDISKLHESTFSYLSNLHLDLSHTTLRNIPFIRRNEVRTLELMGVQIHCSCRWFKVSKLKVYLTGTCVNSYGTSLDIESFAALCNRNRMTSFQTIKETLFGKEPEPVKEPEKTFTEAYLYPLYPLVPYVLKFVYFFKTENEPEAQNIENTNEGRAEIEEDRVELEKDGDEFDENDKNDYSNEMDDCQFVSAFHRRHNYIPLSTWMSFTAAFVYIIVILATISQLYRISSWEFVWGFSGKD